MNLADYQKELQEKIKDRQSKLDFSGFARGYKPKPLTELEIAQRESCRVFEEYEELVQEELILEQIRRNKEQALLDLSYLLYSLQAYHDYKSDANRVDREDPQNALFQKFGEEGYKRVLCESYRQILMLLYRDLIEARQLLNDHHRWTGFCRKSIDQIFVETISGYEDYNRWIEGCLTYIRQLLLSNNDELFTMIRSL